MKNNIFSNLWVVYKDTLPEVTLKRIPRIEQCIQEFEAMGYDLSTMDRAAAKEFGKLIGNKLAFTSAVAYCSVINKFLTLCEQHTGTQYEHVSSNMIPVRCDLYLTENEFLDDVHRRAGILVDSIKTEKHLDDDSAKHTAEHYYGAICLLVLTWYGLTYDEISNLKLTDINDEDKTIVLNRNDKLVIKQLSTRAFAAVARYKNLKAITSYYRNPVTFTLPKSGYLFRHARNSKDEAVLTSPVSVIALTAIKFKFCKDSNIKKNIELSGAFSTIEERLSMPTSLCERVHDYLGDMPVSDTTIRNNWIIYLDELGKAQEARRA